MTQFISHSHQYTQPNIQLCHSTALSWFTTVFHQQTINVMSSLKNYKLTKIFANLINKRCFTERVYLHPQNITNFTEFGKAHHS